jgi:hypothetical protein
MKKLVTCIAFAAVVGSGFAWSRKAPSPQVDVIANSAPAASEGPVREIEFEPDVIVAHMPEPGESGDRAL